MTNVCVVTGTRAEYGLLYWVMKGIEASATLDLRVIVTGMHLSPEFGLTHRLIEADGFTIHERVEMLMSSDTPVGIAKSIGLGTIGMADALARQKPDVLLLLGDRFEIFAAAQAALVARIPVVHLCGGDSTEGASDEAIRHAITKMAHVHLVTNEDSARRVRQLGEDPAQVHVVGNPGLDHLHRLDLLDRPEVEARLGFTLRERNLLITFHPVTLDERPAAGPFSELLEALDSFGADTGLIFTRPNADGFGRVLVTMIDEFVATRNHAVAHTSLGQQLYLSTARLVDAMVGNSSSGLLEAPSLGIATVDIGDRQKGRPRASSVIHVDGGVSAIRAAVSGAIGLDCSKVVNPYGDGRSAPRIVSVLENIGDPRSLVKKRFFDIPA